MRSWTRLAKSEGARYAAKFSDWGSHCHCNRQWALLASKFVSGSGQTTITANNNTIINFGAGQVEMTPEMFKTVVETAIKNKKELAENTVRFLPRHVQMVQLPSPLTAMIQ